MNTKLKLFSKIRESRTHRILCAFLAINILAEIVSPTVAMALTSGPSLPEFSSFEPVATTDMVNDFSGDFTYNIPVLNIPGPDGGGYSMSMAYHSGSSSEEEASWVGFGWTLNPGAINRNKRGLADEFNGVKVTNYNKQKPNWTQSAKFDLNLEIQSNDQGKDGKAGGAKANKKAGEKVFSGIGKGAGGGGNEGTDPAEISLSVSHTVRYNNYSGFSIANGFGVGIAGMANLSMNRSGTQNTFGFSVNPAAIVRSLRKEKALSQAEQAEQNLSEQNKKLGEKIIKNTKNKIISGLINRSYSIHSFEAPALSYSVAKHAGASWNFSASVELNVNIPVGIQVGIAGNMNIQAQDGIEDKLAYGYLYSSEANTGNDAGVMHDYQIEKETTFNKHDKNLGIPFNTADVFSATGNNVTGGFRLHHPSIGNYYPDKVSSDTKIRQIGVELGIGATFQIGFDIGVGKQVTEVKGLWPKMAGQPEYTNASDAFMRFDGDMGGELKYDADYNKNVSTTIDKKNKTIDTAPLQLTLDQNKGASSHINYLQVGSNTNPSIKGIEITSKDGGKSNYTKPVYTKEEMQLTVGISDNHDGAYLVAEPLNYADPMQHKSAVGQFTEDEYASTYLLESNTTFNYVDVDANGPSDDDFGGWTKFDYRQVYGHGKASWYRYRSPYAGLNYNAGRMLDKKDQTGSMSSGYKEVQYLKCIQTKTHIAFFVTNKTTGADFPIADFPFLYTSGNTIDPSLITGSGIDRNDGLDAAAIAGGMDAAAASLDAKGLNKLEKLEKIILFAKADLSKPLTTTYFQYDYSLCQGIPNSAALASAPANQKGKLTLKKVWTESGGTVQSRISPYQFHYEYFHNYPTTITDKYPWIAPYNTQYTSNDPNQNPIYKPEHLDNWGNYQENGAQRFTNMQAWVSQRSSSVSYDPAAWQLKRIQLPSGGEIHVQYEQKDYSSVQDCLPMSMVSLLSDDNENDYNSDKSKFCINTADLNVQDMAAYARRLRYHFLQQCNKLYFKVLYSFTDGNMMPQINNTDDIGAEYVTGYVVVNDVEEDNGKIYLHLGEKHGNGTGKEDKTLPRFVCYQELLGNGGRNLGPNAPGNYEDDDDMYTGIAYPANATNLDPQDFTDMARQHVLSNTIDMFKGWIESKVKNTRKKDACKKINFDLSYFKLPVEANKKGGGIRVKRILTYDTGISGEMNGDETLFGTEYIYKNENGTSSGVAVNEPSSGREDNSLVGYLERKKQKLLSKLTNGRDTKQFEGALGESVLPAASIGYGRVVIKNIHSGNTNTGYVVNKYATAKDHPFSVDFSPISKHDETYRKFNLNLPLGLFNLDIHRNWITQGYIFKQNDMHGKIVSKATYSGNYNNADFKESTFISKSIYDYSQRGQSIPSLVYDSGTKKFTRQMLNPGTEEDFTMFSANVKEKSNDFSVEIDINVMTVPSYVSLGFGLSYSLSEQLLCQHITSKVVNQKTYLMATTNITDGVTQTTENLAFDKYTGDPVLTRTFDGYMAPNEKINLEKDPANVKHEGYYYAFNVPASWMYPSMGPKTTANPNNTNQLTAMAGSVVTYSTNTLFSQVLANHTPLATWDPIAAPLTNVVSASSTSYKKDWFTDATVQAEYGITPLSTQIKNTLNGFYYPLTTYAYKEKVTDANSTNGKIYNGGITTVNFPFFDWKGQEAGTYTVPQEWYSGSQVTLYSPFGYPIEEKDFLGIKSSAKFGYGNTLPVSVVKNAGFYESKFIDFEYGFNPSGPLDPNISLQYAHSGRASYNLKLNPTYTFVEDYPLSNAIINSKGLGVKLWVRSSLNDNSPANANFGLKNTNPQLHVIIGQYYFPCKMIAQVGEWALFGADITFFNGINAGLKDVSLSYITQGNETVYVDDFRIQPLDASMNCSVYTADNKVAAQFDDQHFGVYYEYNHKGQLVRKSIETERGKKTLQEQQYNTPETIRN
jgi:hypothetical protein